MKTMSHRDEAIKAIDMTTARLGNDDPITPLDRRLIIATLEHARVCVQSIEELKRKRPQRRPA